MINEIEVFNCSRLFYFPEVSKNFRKTFVLFSDIALK